MPRVFHRSSYLVLLLLPACVEKNSLGSLDSSTGATLTVGTGSAGDTTGEPADPTATSTAPADVTTSAATTTVADTDTTDQGFISSPDLGVMSMCDCPDDMLCVQSHGLDSWFFVCAIPPPDCDPTDLCSQACATACAVPPPLPEMCDGREPPPFLDCNDAAGFQCSTWAANCPAGSKCVPYPDDPDIRCEPVVERPAEPGEPCTGPIDGALSDTCVVGSGCWGFESATQEHVCAVHCTGTVADPECPPTTGCIIDPTGLVAVCLTSCDPLLQDCGVGQACVPGLEAFVCVEDLSGGGGQELDACAGLDFCDPGLVCVDHTRLPDCDGSESCCTLYCDLDDPSCPVPGTVCEPMFAQGQAPPGADNVGLCVLP